MFRSECGSEGKEIMEAETAVNEAISVELLNNTIRFSCLRAHRAGVIDDAES